ncbi:MAG: site-specific integrase [Deltaproteobacteria bacterium]|nr:site-specific integrase [Deltaproteobacteria bacterium]
MAMIRKRGKSYQIDYFDPSGRRVRKSFRKKKDAEAELGKRVSLIAEGRYLDVKRELKITLEGLIDRYEENYKHQTSFWNAKKGYLRNFKEYFGKDTLLANIGYANLETYRNHLRRSLTRNGTIRTEASTNREISCLHHLFEKAVEWEMVEQSPFKKGRSLILKENNRRLRYLSQEEIVRLLDSCSTRVIEFPRKRGHITRMTRKDPDYLRDIVECALLTGMRRGEILGLKWDQVRNGFIYLTKTKTNEARQIPVSGDLESLFKRIRARNGLKSPYVFTYQGKPVTEIKTAFNAALKRAGIRDFRFHDLRHTFASQLIMRGGSLKDVQELLGHKTMTMTLRYAHLSQEHKKKAVNLLNGLTDSTAPILNCHKTVTFSNQEKIASL